MECDMIHWNTNKFELSNFQYLEKASLKDNFFPWLFSLYKFVTRHRGSFMHTSSLCSYTILTCYWLSSFLVFLIDALCLKHQVVDHPFIIFLFLLMIILLLLLYLMDLALLLKLFLVQYFFQSSISCILSQLVYYRFRSVNDVIFNWWIFNWLRAIALNSNLNLAIIFINFVLVCNHFVFWV